MQYFGGKARISAQIAGFINNINNGGTICDTSVAKLEYQNTLQNILTHTHTHTHYIEPFCGACNVASKVNIPNKILNDKHPYLIEMFKALQNGWIPPEIITEEQYKYIKKNLDEDKALSGFVGFGCSFAGKWFGGYARSKRGDNSCSYARISRDSVMNKMKTLQHSLFLNGDFRDINIYNNAIVYCDIPYKNTTQYNKKLLGDFPYQEFLEWVKKQSKNNIVLISEYKHNLPNNAKIVLEIESKTSIRNKNKNVIPTTEILFTYNDI